MPAPFFTTNPAEFTRLEGLYISEKDPPGFISGVSLNTVGVVGQTLRGPVDQAVEISSPTQFFDIFGGRGRGAGQPLVNQVWRFLLNKPFGKVVVTRAAAAAAASASMNHETLLDGTGTEVLTVAATSPGAWGNDVSVKIEAATDGNANHFNLVVKYLGSETEYQNLDITAGNDNTAVTLGDALTNVVVLTKVADGRPSNTADVTEAAFVAARDTDNFVPLGLTLGAYTTVAGADGTIAATDYTAAGRAWDQLKSRKNVSVVTYAEDDATIVGAINAIVPTSAAAVSDKIFLIWNGVHSAAVSAVATDAASYRSDRIVYCYNSPKTVDTETALKIETPPTSWMASILSQTDVDVHPGAESSKSILAGITDLNNEALTREDYITLKAAGVSALERDDGFLFVSGLTTSLVAGKTEITRRRMADFLQLSAANRLKSFVKLKNTPTNRSIIAGELTAFSQTLKDTERVVEDYVIVSDEVNTEVTRAQGIEKVLWRVRLIGHILHLVLETEIGTGVTVETA